MHLLAAYPGEKTERKFQYVRDALNFLLKLFSSDWIGIVHIHIGKGNPQILLCTDCLKWSTGFSWYDFN